MGSHVLTTGLTECLNSIAQSCGLSLPTLTSEVGPCSCRRSLTPFLSLHRLQSLPARGPARQPERVTTQADIVAYLCQCSSSASASWPRRSHGLRPEFASRVPVRALRTGCRRVASAKPSAATSPSAIQESKACTDARVRSPDRDGIDDCDLEVTNEHVRSQECCERRRLAGGGVLPLAAVCRRLRLRRVD